MTDNLADYTTAEERAELDTPEKIAAFVNNYVTTENYFPIVSTKLLGQNQPAQFQSSTQTGYWWGSKVSDDGNYTELDSIVTNHNSTISRSFQQPISGYGALYNYYAATAESNDYYVGDSPDTICPFGWHIPRTGQNNTTDKTWRKLIYGAYGLSDYDVDSSLFLTKVPFSGLLQGEYYEESWIVLQRTNGPITSDASSVGGVLRMNFSKNGVQIVGDSGINKTRGVAVRCILK